MMIMPVGPALMRDSASRLAITSNNIANAQTPGFEASTARAFEPPQPTGAPALPQDALLPGSNVDLGQEIVNLIEIENAYKLGAKLVAVDAELAQETLDMIR